MSPLLFLAITVVAFLVLGAFLLVVAPPILSARIRRGEEETARK